MDIENKLLSMRDIKYKEFHKKLMPTVPEEKIIGIRIPALRKFAKEICGTHEAENFINSLPHKYYEEDNLHAFLLEDINDFDDAVSRCTEFLPYIDNWATCDSFLPKTFVKNRDRLVLCINEWINSERTYVVRYAIGLLMKLYLDEYFKPEYMQAVASVQSDEYYVKMMQAWYFATALAKQYDYAIEYLLGKKLDVWVHNKAIQKAVESRRIENKDYLKTLKINRRKNK